jgi:hypothetical protein
MKKLKPIQITIDRPAKARRQARQSVGAVAPTRVLTPKTQRPPRHKKPLVEDDAL